MASYRILIVDDQIDIRRMLRIGVENLGPNFRALDMPSAEEALLEMMRQPVDLLISDIRLPGISGLELIAKARKRQPELKTILITALNDLPTLQQAAEAGANALFHKPLDMPVFLDSVRRILGVTVSDLPPASGKLYSPVEGLGERLASLRKECSASAVIFMNDQGQILAQAGALPEAIPQAALIPALLVTLSASRKVSVNLGVEPPRNLIYFPGAGYWLCLASVGSARALLAITPASSRQPGPPAVDVIEAAVQDLLAFVAQLEGQSALSPGQPGRPPVESPPMQPSAPDGLLRPEEITQIEGLFQDYARPLDSNDLDRFWDQAAQESEINNLGSDSVITYDQAKKLGLAPKD